MIATLFWSRDEFAAKRRKDQDTATELLLESVKDSIFQEEVTDELKRDVLDLFKAAYKTETGAEWQGNVPPPVSKAVASLIDNSTPDSNANTTALAIASMLLNAASIEAAIDDEDEVFLEWVTMHDGAVRQAHKDTDGQVRPAGEKFDVDGVEMSMPGDVTAPIELWINCRCTLRPTFPPTEFRDVSKDERDRRSKDGTAMPDGSYPIANCQDLRNAIQAIGRAKDPDKVKAHIRKRKKALGCPDVELPWGSETEDFTVPPNGDFVGHTVPGGGTMTETSNKITLHTGGSPTTTSTGQLTWTGTSGQTVTDVVVFDASTKAEDEALHRLAEMDEEQQDAFESLVPWHGVLAPEGEKSGDGRMFAPDSLTHRDLPLPLTYQKAQSSGHDGSVVVGSIETIERVDGLMLASGYFLSTPEADEVIGLIAHFGKYGVSIDADDAEFDYEESDDSVTFTRGRICSASLVSIPAFAQAYVTLGPWAEDEALVASGVVFKDLAPGKTEDGPGWLTHPVDTDRLRDYWVRGPGAAKIGWGTPGDFNRCRLNLAKYVKPQYLSGYCANRHYDALGFWPGRPVAGETIPFVEGATEAPALSLVASARPEAITAPAAWFEDPQLTSPTHLTVTAEGRVYGHAAEWGVCHIGISGVCTTAPHSLTDYASFANKAVLLDNGEFARTGVIHLGGKHMRGGRHSAASVTQHYDDTSRAVADVAIGEDQFGIWVAGWVRPGTSEEDIAALRASDISGDWREIDRRSGDMEMVALLAVNAGGFPVRVAASGGQMVSLVAAGMVQSTEETTMSEADKMAEAIAKALERVEENKRQRAATMKSLRDEFVKEN
jgi:hypothetical protein